MYRLCEISNQGVKRTCNNNYNMLKYAAFLKYSPGPFIRSSNKKVFFDFAVALCSIGAPDIPKNFARRSEMENMVF